MAGLTADTNWHKMACRANLWYNMTIENVFALAVLEHSRADEEKGTLLMSSSISRQKKPGLERFLSYVSVQENGCWLWTGGKNGDGYGNFRDENRVSRGAHRWSYEYFVGPVPQGLDLDHLCRNRACVHPEHLEPVSHRENGHRGARGVLKDKKTSQYLGVYWVKKRNKWSAQIQLDGEIRYLGYFDDEGLAHQAYVEAYDAYMANGTLPARLTVKKTSRYPGVCWNEIAKKWIVQARIDGKQRYIGRFIDEEEAYQAYLKAIEDNTK
jgi:hypothetical protein